MNVLKKINLNNIILPYQIGKSIGFGGADGEVFEILNDKKYVIKLSILYDYDSNDILNEYKRISKVLSAITEQKCYAYARTYAHGYLGKFHRTIYDGSKQEYILYYYVMEKLNKISDDEKRIFHTILSHEDRGFGFEKKLSMDQIKKILPEMGRSLDFDEPKVIFFCENIDKASIVHNDIHVRNIMKDNFGNFKLIDFDRCSSKIGG